ncbi:MAG: sulfatase-like hydrolase/transferase [Hyphomicrobiales bacterium]|nr:sulfatase-like hydrolase/transferase [Hyphomicrobiales bacterium]
MSTKPNVLFITVDHWAAELLGVAGHPAISTPGLNELAHCGVRYTNAYSECPVCIPARRSIMTGMSPRGHGDRNFQETLPMPAGVTTLAQAFRNGGYQAYGVGKLHVYPQRDRIGFDDVILEEEGRTQYGVMDDYDIYLGDVGYAGRQHDHGMSNNQYYYRAWHLPEEHHATNWATRMMARTIKRRDPTCPAFWYLSYRHPHPPLVPLQAYIDLYRDVEIDAPYVGDWVSDPEGRAYEIAAMCSRIARYSPDEVRAARMALYAMCTHIDHQIRSLVGTLRVEGLLDDTVICFTADHGDMLGNHDMLAKRVFYEASANVPLILVGTKDGGRVPVGETDDRVVGLQDIMPTLLDLCGLEVPETVEGQSMLGEARRSWLFGDSGEGDHSSRMIHDGRHKLIYYPVGNHTQLFDLDEDPKELRDVAAEPAYTEVRDRLTEILIGQLYGEDLDWVEDGRLVGRPNKPYVVGPNRSMSSMRGDGWPPAPKVDIVQIEWHTEAKDAGAPGD